MKQNTMNLTKKAAITLIIIFGIVSLFADMNYEGGRSVVGQYLKLLGSSAFVLGVAAGIGEFVGYALRFVSGTIAFLIFERVGKAIRKPAHDAVIPGNIGLS